MRRLVVPLAVALGLGTWAIPSASATPTTPGVGCGAVISSSVRLTADLRCGATAFSVIPLPGGSPIVVDLAGHSVRSAAGPTVVVNGSAATVTIRDGRVFGTIDDTSSRTTYTGLVLDGGQLHAVENAFPTVRADRFVHGASVFMSADSATIEDNTFVGTGSGTAMALYSTFGVVTGNVVSGYSTGVQFADDFSRATVLHNWLARNGTGLRIGGSTGDTVPGVVGGNWFVANTEDGAFFGVGTGIAAPGQVGGLSATGNVAALNGGDGIHVAATGGWGIALTITGTTAVHNGGYGIESPGDIPNTNPNLDVRVTDGGGNKAVANGGPAQCLNVVCRP